MVSAHVKAQIMLASMYKALLTMTLVPASADAFLLVRLYYCC